jgi:transposase
MTKEELRTRIEAELLTGAEPRELEEKYGVPYPTILGWKKKLLKEAPTEDIAELTNATKATLEIVREKAKEEAPVVAKKIDKIIDGVEGLKILEPEFHSVMHKAVKRAHSFIEKDDLTIKEWELITKTLANAYSAIFNKGGTNVNVVQTNLNANQEALSFFKASKKDI